MVAATKKLTSTSKEKNNQRIRDSGKEYAKKRYVGYFVDSSIADKAGTYPKFEKEQLKLGKVLGKGGFGTVYEVRGIQPIDDDDNKNNKTNDESSSPEERQFIADHCLRDKDDSNGGGGDSRYAIKILSPEVVNDPGSFIQGILDMAIETRIMCDTEHPNIIKARALAKISPFSENYFIIMDRLYDTMESRITKWAKTFKRCSGLGAKIFDRKGGKKKEIWDDKLVAAFDLSDALGYLHGRNIIYRDIKPENIGFDVRDDVKIFDFGLATEMNERREVKDSDLYKLTGMTGSPRYMAPEVANGENYNESCDVYSFGLLFWQMLSTKTPFEVYTMKVLEKRVWNGEHKRPFIDTSWSDSIKELLESSWHKDITKRPSFRVITDRLRKECINARGGDDEGLEHSRRRSTFVFDKGYRNQMMKILSVSDFMSSKNLNDDESGVNKTSRPVLSGIIECEKQ